MHFGSHCLSIALIALLLGCSTSNGAPPANSGGATAIGQGGASGSNNPPASGGTSSNPSVGGSAGAHGGETSGPFGGGGSTSLTTGGAAGATAVGGAGNPGDAGTSSGDAGLPAAGDYWKPTAGLSWQWQLSESVTQILRVDVYDIDWESDAATVAALHAQGIKVICYVSVGSWEDFRPDAADFPAGVIGNDYVGWPGEKYVDIRSEGLHSVMLARFDVCKQKGFDAIEPDNMDVFELGSDSGFPLTEQDGIDYALWMAAQAHARGLGIGQKNASSITAQIVDSYQWALTESCYSDGDWCGDVAAYTDANMPVFMCEYESGSFSDACSSWQPSHYSPILKGMDLDAPVTDCP